ncbi:MAG TPA: Gmad2 immunoglobulin-like domain-containing protein [Chloroflexaceae bacterium]|nr:Gmad2 immunoglobulin-like domain-containing protein [Chloroflexaceae bacterium]
MRRPLILALLALIALALLPARDVGAQTDQRCFNETGYCISGPIRQYWERNGGLPVFGFPITPLQTETVEGWTGPVQWFERDRLEDHSAQRQGVLAGRLGVERLAQQGRPWQFRPLGNTVPDCIGFRETGYYACGGFRTYWERNGGLERFGYPITDPMVERLNGRDYLVQYFERRRMEYHPENRPPFDILLGLLGSEVRANSGPVVQPTPTPPPPAPSQQITLSEPGDNQVISSPVRISGTTARPPAGGTLRYRFYEPNGRELTRGNIAVTGSPGSFRQTIAYIAPNGERVIIELAEIDPATGAVIARTERSVRYAPTTAQQIFIDSPASGSRLGNRITVSGRTSLYPSEGDLFLAVIDSTGRNLARFNFAVEGAPGQPVSFSATVDLPEQGGRLVAVEITDVNARGDLLARAEVNVFAGTPGAYPQP